MTNFQPTITPNTHLSKQARPLVLRIFTLFFFLFSTIFYPLLSAQTGVLDESPNLDQQSARYTTQAVDLPALKNQSVNGVLSNITLPLPNKSTDFLLTQNQVLSPTLANSYPDLQTYNLRTIDGEETGKLTINNQQLMAYIETPEGTIIIRPKDAKNGIYESYYVDVEPELEGIHLDCETNTDSTDNQLINRTNNLSNGRGPSNGFSTATARRTYRLAIVTTEEFGNEYGSNAMAVVTSTVQAWNTIYENDLNITFNLVATEIHSSSNPSAPFLTMTDQSGGHSRTNQAAETVEGHFDRNDYDVGHIFHHSSNNNNWSGGGVAALGVICQNYDRTSSDGDGIRGAAKGAGWSGSFNNTSNGWFQLSAHEIGHMFGAFHTFNGAGSNCVGGNHPRSSAYEIASGTTLMSYNGICAASYNIPSAGTADNYFHTISIAQMLSYIANGGECGSTAGNNAVPVLNADPCAAGNVTIPKGTPFKLTGSATDANGDDLLYVWEQIDEDGANTRPTQGATLTQAGADGFTADSSTLAPLFRSFPPSSTGFERTFPSSADGQSTEFEVLPQVARTMNFALTVRDGNGGTVCAERGITVSNNGPLEIGNPCAGGSLSSGENVSLPITTNGSSCTTAKVYLSIDGGQTFPFDLGAIPYSNGNQSVALPEAIPNTTTARFKVVCEDNPCAQFFQISTLDCTISSSCIAQGSTLCPTTTVNANEGDAALNLTINPLFSTSGLTQKAISITGNSLGGSSPLADNPGSSNCVSANFGYRHEVIYFQVDETGSYSIGNNSGQFTIMSVFEGTSYNPNNPCADNLVKAASNFNNGNCGCSGFTSFSMNLTECTDYYLVFGRSNGFSTTLSFSGAGNVLEKQAPTNGTSYTYIAINQDNNQIAAVNANADFRGLTDNGTITYAVYGVSYDNSETPANWVGLTQANLTDGSFCAILSTNFSTMTITHDLVCPTLGNLVGASALCANDNSTNLTINNLTNMGSNFGIKYVYANNQLSDGNAIYGLPDNLGTIANNNLTNNKTVAALNNVNYPTAAGTYYVYAILSPTPSDAACRPFEESVITINAAPSAPTASNVTYCVGDSPDALTASGANLTWYTVATGGSGSNAAPTPSTSEAGVTNYYVSQTIDNCESSRTNILVTINANPDAPTVADVNYCVNETPTALTAMGTNLKWYDAATGGNEISTPTPSTANAGTQEFWVSQTVNNCESSRAKITVTVFANPNPPTVSDVDYCVGETASTLTATGTNLKWYDAATGGNEISTPTPSTTNAGTQAFWVSQTVNNCESPRVKITITVFANPTIALGAITQPSSCNGTDGSIQITGLAANVDYSLTYKKEEIAQAAINLTNVTSATIPNLEAAAYTEIKVTTTNNCVSNELSQSLTDPNAPTVEAPNNQIVCAEEMTNAVNFSGSTNATFAWTNDNTAINLAASGTGNIPAFAATNNTDSPISATISVTPTLDGCTGTAQTFTITVNPIPVAPTVADVDYCSGETATPLTATGTNLTWYDAATGGNEISTPTPSTANAGTQEFWVSQTVNNCESPRAKITFTVKEKPTMNQPSNQSVENEEQTAAITFTGTTDAIFNWTNDNTAIGLSAVGVGNIPAFTATNSGNSPIVGNISVTPVLDGCTGTVQNFTITVNPSPNISNDTIMIAGIIDADTTITACELLVSNSTIQENLTVHFFSGEVIQLTTGFVVPAGSTFSAQIQDCDDENNLSSDAIAALAKNQSVSLKRAFTNKLTIYPNPARDIVFLNYQINAKEKVAFQLYDITGKVIKEIMPLANGEMGVYRQRLDISDLQDGMYFLILQQGGEVITRKLVVGR